MVPKIGLMVPKKWYDPIGSILQRFYLKIHIINDFWGGVPDLMVFKRGQNMRRYKAYKCNLDPQM